MDNTTQTYKRQYREQSPETRQKISAKMANRPKSDTHRQHISDGLKSYWEGVPSQPNGMDTCPEDYI